VAIVPINRGRYSIGQERRDHPDAAGGALDGLEMEGGLADCGLLAALEVAADADAGEVAGDAP
jgi:hypothetical protein